MASGGVYRYNDGREVPDHIYAIFDYPGGRTAIFSSIESNALRGPLRDLLRHEGHAIW